MLSEKDLRSTLRKELKDSGVVDMLTAQLRADFVRRISRGGSAAGASISAQSKRAWDPPAEEEGGGMVQDKSIMSNKENLLHKGGQKLSLEDRAVRSLILNYLKASSMTHTISVFAPESGVKESPLSPEECLKSLGVSELSGAYKDVIEAKGEGSDPPLKRVLDCFGAMSHARAVTSAGSVAAAGESSSMSSSQVPLHKGGDFPTAQESLTQKLIALQEQHEKALHHTRVNPDKSFEEKMLAFHKECEDRLSKQMQRDLERFRQHDIDMMRLEEQSKFRAELQALRSEMKAEYDLRVQKAEEVKDRKLQNARLQSQQLEAAQYQARQEVVRELDMVRRREIDSRRELDVRKRALELDEQRLNNLKLTLDGQKDELKKQEVNLKHRYEAEFDRAQREAKKTYTAANDAILAQQQVLETELGSARREREDLKKVRCYWRSRCIHICFAF